MNPESPISLEELASFTQTHANLLTDHEKRLALIVEVMGELLASISTDFSFLRVELLKMMSDDYQAKAKYTNRGLLGRVEELQNKVDYLTDKLFEKKDDKPMKTSGKL